MTVPLVDLKAQYEGMKDELDTAVAEVVASQRFILGPAVEQLEAAVAGFSHTAHAVGCASGTDALLLALRALELERGAEVVVPSFTFFATAGAVWNAGLRPVFAEIDPATFNVTADSVRAVLTPRSRAIIAVHLYGQMAPMDELRALSREHDLALIEDAAQSFGARQHAGDDWQPAGSVGDIGCLSFFPAKVLGGYGDAGMVVTNDDDLAERVRKLRVHGGRQMYHHEMVGTNSRLDALQAAVLTAKLPHVPAWLEARRRNAAAYAERFEGVDGVRTPTVAPGNEHAFGVYTLRVADRDGLKARLDEAGIGNAVYYPLGLHLQECFAELGYRAGDLPETERATGEVVSLPIYPELDEGQIEEVSAVVRGHYGA